MVVYIIEISVPTVQAPAPIALLISMEMLDVTGGMRVIGVLGGIPHPLRANRGLHWMPHCSKKRT